MKNKKIILFGKNGNLGNYLYNNLNNYNVIGYSKYECNTSNQSNIKNILDKNSDTDVIINTVGLVKPRPFKDCDKEYTDKMLNINFKSIYNILKISIPFFIKRKEGYVINISSIRGITGAPNKSIYSASKFAVQGLIDSLRLELKDTKIKLTNICPGKIGDTVTEEDIAKVINCILSLSDKTYLRNVILGGQL